MLRGKTERLKRTREAGLLFYGSQGSPPINWQLTWRKHWSEPSGHVGKSSCEKGIICAKSLGTELGENKNVRQSELLQSRRREMRQKKGQTCLLPNSTISGVGQPRSLPLPDTYPASSTVPLLQSLNTQGHSLRFSLRGHPVHLIKNKQNQVISHSKKAHICTFNHSP